MTTMAVELYSVPTEARIVRVRQLDELDQAVDDLGLAAAPGCLALVGGADGMTALETVRAVPFFRDALVPLAERLGAVVVDGGTDCGVMALAGRARAERQASFPLVGVVLAALTTEGRNDGVPLESHHTHFVAVPGSNWGDEGRWLDALATAVAPTRGATILVNGGDISWTDVERSVAARRPVISVAGSGRTADELAAGVRGVSTDGRAAELAASDLIHVVDLDDLDGLSSLVERLLGG